ncbi:MAG: phospholipase A2 [Actinomycetota bacterium]|nr:phospholipase A2 [Actinomycetota bacterium]
MLRWGRANCAAAAALALLLSPSAWSVAQADTYRSGHPPVLSSATIDSQRRLVVTYTAPDGVTYGGTVYLDSNPLNATAPPGQYGPIMYCNNKSICAGRWKLAATPNSGPFTYSTEPLDMKKFPSGTYWVQVETTNEDPYASTRYWEDSNVVSVTLPGVPAPRKPVSLESVSNGCGGGEVGDDPRFLDEVSFSSGTKGLRFKVRFRQACNIHDAGYGGYKIRNPLHKNTGVDYLAVPRKTIDDQFLRDLRLLCDEQLPKSQSAAGAKKQCYAYAKAYWIAVREGLLDSCTRSGVQIL